MKKKEKKMYIGVRDSILAYVITMYVQLQILMYYYKLQCRLIFLYFTCE